MIRLKIINVLCISLAATLGDSYLHAQAPRTANSKRNSSMPACLTPLQTKRTTIEIDVNASISGSVANVVTAADGPRLPAPGRNYQPVIFPASLYAESKDPISKIQQTALTLPQKNATLQPGLNTQSIELGFENCQLVNSDCTTDSLAECKESQSEGTSAIDNWVTESDHQTEPQFENLMLQPLTESELNEPKRHEPEWSKISPEQFPLHSPVAHDSTKDEDPSTQPNEDQVDSPAEDDIEKTSELVVESTSQDQTDRNEQPLAEVQSEELHAYETGAIINFSDTPPTQFETTSPAQQLSNADYPDQIQERLEGEQTTGGLIIHPPMIQPYNKNQHTFVVENRGASTAQDVIVEFSVPDDAKIIATLPLNSVLSPSKAVFRFDEILAGDQVQIHINAISTGTQPIGFVANLVTRSTYEFDANIKNIHSELKKVSYRLSTACETATPPAHQRPDTSAILVRNPFVDHSRYLQQQANHVDKNSRRR